jgi:hypothetical protein
MAVISPLMPRDALQQRQQQARDGGETERAA